MCYNYKIQDFCFQCCCHLGWNCPVGLLLIKQSQLYGNYITVWIVTRFKFFIWWNEELKSLRWPVSDFTDLKWTNSSYFRIHLVMAIFDSNLSTTLLLVYGFSKQFRASFVLLESSVRYSPEMQTNHNSCRVVRNKKLAKASSSSFSRFQLDVGVATFWFYATFMLTKNSTTITSKNNDCKVLEQYTRVTWKFSDLNVNISELVNKS